MAKLLVIDDDIALLARLAGQLSEAGYDVVKTSDIASAEWLFADQRPDMVLLEVKTERDAGWNLLERLASQVPVLVISAAGREEDVVRGLDAGAIDYLAKPYRSDELLTRIRIRLRAAPAFDVQAQAVTGETTVLPAETVPDASPAPQAEAPADTSDDAADRADIAANAAAAPVQGGETVFMSDEEELALLRNSDDATPEAQDMLAPDKSLGATLRAERQRRRLTLVQIENDLHIRMWYLQAMEEENFTLLPRGPMAENMLRDYARHLGVDVEWALQEYERLYASNRVEPTPAFTSERRFTMPRWVIRVSAVVLALVVSGTGLFLLDPDGITTLGDNLQQLIAAPAPSPTPEPTATLQPGADPTSTNVPTPSATPAPTVTPSPTPSNPPPRDVPAPN